MNNLSKSVEKRFRANAQNPQTPPWWNVAQVLIGVAFFVYLAYSLLAPSDNKSQVEVTPTTQESATESTQTTPQDQTEATGAPETSSLPTDTTKTNVPAFEGDMATPQTVAFVSGGSTQVPAGLVDLASRSAAGMMGAATDNIPIVEGKLWPQASDWADAVASDVMLAALSDNQATFRVLVSRETQPATAGVWTDINLVAAGDGWAFDPEVS